MSRNVLVIGAAKRVLQTALPAFAAAEPEFRVQSVMAKHDKRIEAAGRSWEVRAFERFAPGDLRGIDLVYLAVSKPVVPNVLARLAACETGAIDLLIDTPVLLPKHFRAMPLLARFRAAWVPEDCAYLPWMPLVQRVIDGGAIGPLQSLVFERSAYAYHAHATLKTLAGTPLHSARRRRLAGGAAVRTLRYYNEVRAELHEPRDYASGRFALVCASGSIADYARDGERSLLLAPEIERGRCTGFRLGGEREALDAREQELMGAVAAGASVTALHEAMKRVGFLRLLRRLQAGQGAYPVHEALEDTLADYVLEKIGWWHTTKLTSPRYALARKLLALGSRLARR